MGRSVQTDLLVLGELNPDILVVADDPVPRFGQTERIVDSITATIGGSGGIVACGAARLGLTTRLHAAVGEDRFGRLTLDALRAHAVDTSACVVDPQLPTGVSVILARPTDRAILTATGAIDALTDVPGELLRSTRHVHVAGWFLRPAIQGALSRVLREAHLHGATTSLDPNWDPSGTWDGLIGDVLAETDIVFVNDQEALHLTGARRLEDAARKLGKLARVQPDGGDPIVVVKRGADGVFGWSGSVVADLHALAVDVADATGCGDSFDAGFLAGFLDGAALRDCFRIGVACGSLAARAVGGTDGQPTREEALAASGRVRSRPHPEHHRRARRPARAAAATRAPATGRRR